MGGWGRIVPRPRLRRRGHDTRRHRPVEWYRGGHEIRAIFRQQVGELGVHKIVPGEMLSFVEGDVGWVVDNPTICFPDGIEGVLRSTLIFRREASGWRIVHWHASIGSSNEEVLGHEVTTTIEAVADAVELERPDLAPMMSPEGTVTIMFTDMEASTATNEALGDDRFLPVLLQHNKIVEERTRSVGGTVVKSQGDGFMLAFPSARRAVECAIAVQKEVSLLDHAIKVRMGLHTGEPIRHADDFFGRDVAYAARIGSAARGGEILVSSLVRSLVEPSGSFQFDSPRELEFKGFEGQQPVYAVSW